jgi:hypothetical protein
MASRTTLALAAFVTALACAAPALAEPSAADKATARNLMAEGRAARERGDANAALKAFSGADAIMHVPTTGLELARSQAAVKALVEARDTALHVVRLPEAANEPPPFHAAREAALALVKELDKRIPTLAIAVGGGATAQVTIDGVDVPAAELAQPRRLNPGHHTVQASFGGAATGGAKSGSVDRQVDLAEGDAKRVSLEAPAVAGSAPPPGGQQAPEAEPASAAEHADTASENPPPEAPSSRMSPAGTVLTFGGFGLAGVGLIAGAVTGLITLTTTSSIKSSGHCFGDTCGPEEHDRISSANTMATIANVSFAVAGAGAVAGLVGLLLPKTSSQPPADDTATTPTTSRIEPWIGVGSAGVRGQF